MAKKCCYFERGDEAILTCTIDDDCPQMTGWTQVGTWGVEDCDDCFGTLEPPPETPPDSVGVRPGQVGLDFAEITAIYTWVIKNWEKIFPHNPLDPTIEGFDDIEGIIDKIRR